MDATILLLLLAKINLEKLLYVHHHHHHPERLRVPAAWPRWSASS
jgi:hypothetical protein